MNAVSRSVPTTLKVAKKFSLPGIGFCMARGDAASQMFFGCSDFGVYHIDSVSDKPVAAAISEQRHNSYVTGLVRNGETLISGSYDGSLVWWSAENGEILHRIEKAHQKWIRQLAINPDGTVIVSVGDDMKTRLWNAETAASMATFSDHTDHTPHNYPSMLYTATFSADGSKLATGDRTGCVVVRDVESGEIATTLEAPKMYTWDPKARRHSIGGIRSLAFSSDGKLLAVGGMGQVGNIDHLGGAARIEIFDWQSGDRKHEIEDSKFKGLVEQLQFGPNDEWLAAAGGDNSGFVSMFGTADGKVLVQEKAPMHVHDFRLNAECNRINAVGHEQACVVEIV